MAGLLEGVAVGVVLFLAVAAFSYGSRFVPGVDAALLGALLGAAGTIFAGWLVWSQSRDQIASNERLQKQAEITNVEGQIPQIEGEIEYLEAVRGFVVRQIKPLIEAPSTMTKHLDALDRMSTRGELVHPTIIARGQVGSVGTSLFAIVNRLQSLSSNNTRLRSQLSVGDNAARLIEVDEAVRETVKEMQSLLEAIDREHLDRTKRIAKIRDRITQLKTS